MFASGNVTVYISNMDRAVRFYTEVLGLKLASRFGDHWASVEAGKGLTIGLHPASGEMPAGRKGSMAIGLELTGSIEDAMKKLGAKGLEFQEVVNEGQGRQVRGVRGSRRQHALPGGTRLEPREPGRRQIPARLSTAGFPSR
jgi:catechol 2,3-dioxygenase-like lactoylglutathione lyase family enzyme